MSHCTGDRQMHQQTFADALFEHYRKPARREQFLYEMDRVMPWVDLVTVIDPVDPQADGLGGPLVGIERMMCLHRLQFRFKVSDPGSRTSEFPTEYLARSLQK